jgi:hypothetical protein
MKPKRKGDKPMRVRVSTTITADLWQALGIEALKQKVDRNDILEKLIAEYLKKIRQKGMER